MKPIPHDLPGSDLVTQGLKDLADGRETIAAMLVSIGAPRLRRCGVSVPAPLADPEHRLYALISREGSDCAHSRYNSLLRRLISFERALECATYFTPRR
jgi:hypothetical protein